MATFTHPFLRPFSQPIHQLLEPVTTTIADISVASVNGGITWHETGNGDLTFSITDSDRGWVNQTVNSSAADHDIGTALNQSMLNAGPVVLGQPMITAAGQLKVGDQIPILPPIWAHDATSGPVSVAYGGVTGTVDISDPDHPTYLLSAADAGPFSLYADISDGNGTRRVTSNQFDIASGAVVSTIDGHITVDVIDGDPIIISGTGTRFDGTYALDINGNSDWSAQLLAGGFYLRTPEVIDDGTPAAGETLAITPGLFFYNPDIGRPVLTYSTNSTNAVDNSDPAAPTLNTLGDDGTTLTISETWTYPDSTAISATSNGVPIPATSGAMTHHQMTNGAVQHFTSTPTPSVDVDTSALSTGDLLLVCFGSDQDPSEVSVNGNPAFFITRSGGIRNGRRVAVWQYPLTASDIGTSINIQATKISTAINIFDVRAITDAAVDTFDGTQRGSGSFNVSVTPSDPNNVIVGFAMGKEGTFDPFDWDSMTHLYSNDSLVSSARAASGAVAQNVPTSGFTVSGAGNTDDFGVVIVATIPA